jgi:VWFA-related protein
MDARCAVGLAATLVAIAGTTWLQAQQAPVFRSGVEVVTVDVAVVDGKGTPIEGLTADQFDVRVNGAPRRVLWAEFVPHRAIPLDPSGPSESFSSNEHFEPGRLVMVAVDQLHIRRVEGLAALRAASNFVDSLDRADLVAAAPLDDGRPVEFTRDHAAVKRYLERLTGGASLIPSHFNIGLSEALAIGDGSRTQLDMVVRRECGQSLARYESPARMAAADGMRDPCPVQVEQEGRAFAQQARTEARLSIEALTQLIGRLGEIEGQKTLVLVSEGLVAEPRHFDLGALGAAALAARVTLYVLQLDTGLIDAADDKVSPTMQADRSLRADGLARLAGSSRGAMFTLVGSDPYPFRRILRELSGHYLVAFEAVEGDRDGRTHRIAVSARAPGATVRARQAFSLPTVLTAAATGSHIERLLRSPRLSTELPLRVAAYTLKDEATDQLKVLVSAETDHAGHGREVTVGFVVVNGEGVIAASGAGRTESGRYTVPATLPPGRYMVKVAAVDAAGRQGSVERRFNAMLGGAGTVRLSDLMIADPPPAAGTPLEPAAARAAGEHVVMYLEAYAPDDWSPSHDVRFEVRGSSSGDPAVSAQAPFRRTGPGRWVASAEVPLDSVAPGAYLAAAQVPLEPELPQRVTRSFVVAKR